MRNAEEKIHTATGGLVLALIGIGLGYLLVGAVSGLLVIAVIYSAVQLRKGIREKREAQAEMKPAAEDFARALAALQEKKARGRQAV